MGLFSSKKPCPSCSKKLHASWDKCPYCGWTEKGAAPAAKAAAPAPMAAPMPSGGKQRTVALDMSGGAAAQPVVGLGWLVPIEGEASGEVFPLKPRTTVGSSPSCDIHLKDTGVSGRHAEFVFQGGLFKLNDLGSTNGTFVNDKKVSTSELVDNDNVRLGMTNCKFKCL
jgi:hypothetical protein